MSIEFEGIVIALKYRKAINASERTNRPIHHLSLMSRKITMHVMSSITFSSRFHCLNAARTRFSAAPSAFRCKKNGYTMSATYWFSRNSHTPSLARMMILSEGVMRSSEISGTAFTPTRHATWSPNDRVIARPGISSFLSQTRSGPTLLPWLSLYESMRPPAAKMTLASIGSSGLWSRVRGLAIHPTE